MSKRGRGEEGALKHQRLWQAGGASGAGGTDLPTPRPPLVRENPTWNHSWKTAPYKARWQWRTGLRSSTHAQAHTKVKAPASDDDQCGGFALSHVGPELDKFLCS